MGYFYVVQPIPSAPWHLKLGYSDVSGGRLDHYRTLCPELVLIKEYPCPDLTTERRAFEFVVALGFEQISKEVFRCHSLPRLLQGLDMFFGSSLAYDAHHQIVLKRPSRISIKMLEARHPIPKRDQDELIAYLYRELRETRQQRDYYRKRTRSADVEALQKECDRLREENQGLRRLRSNDWILRRQSRKTG